MQNDFYFNVFFSRQTMSDYIPNLSAELNDKSIAWGRDEEHDSDSILELVGEDSNIQEFDISVLPKMKSTDIGSIFSPLGDAYVGIFFEKKEKLQIISGSNDSEYMKKFIPEYEHDVVLPSGLGTKVKKEFQDRNLTFEEGDFLIVKPEVVMSVPKNAKIYVYSSEELDIQELYGKEKKISPPKKISNGKSKTVLKKKDSDLSKLSIKDLNQKLKEFDLKPSDYKNKDDKIAAIQENDDGLSDLSIKELNKILKELGENPNSVRTQGKKIAVIRKKRKEIPAEEEPVEEEPAEEEPAEEEPAEEEPAEEEEPVEEEPAEEEEPPKKEDDGPRVKRGPPSRGGRRGRRN